MSEIFLTPFKTPSEVSAVKGILTRFPAPLSGAGHRPDGNAGGPDAVGTPDGALADREGQAGPHSAGENEAKYSFTGGISWGGLYGASEIFRTARKTRV